MNLISYPEYLEKQLKIDLLRLGFKWEQIPQLASTVLKISDHYQQDQKVSLWQKADWIAAYLVYFRTLNQVRWLRLLQHLPNDFFAGNEEFVDFGAGPATLPLLFLNQYCPDLKSWTALENSNLLADFYSVLSNPKVLFRNSQLPRAASSKNQLLLCSYSLNELTELPEHLWSYNKVIIMEPSTKQAFARLLELRQNFLDKGYKIVAPCPHQLRCPMSGGKDWCHDRVHWQQPTWFEKLEENLPIKNTTLTFSYLAVEKSSESVKHESAPTAQSIEETPIRIVGDDLKEKGKSRWLACSGSDRHFISSLHRHGPPPDILRGDLIRIQEREIKGQEWRVHPNSVSKIKPT